MRGKHSRLSNDTIQRMKGKNGALRRGATTENLTRAPNDHHNDNDFKRDLRNLGDEKKRINSRKNSRFFDHKKHEVPCLTQHVRARHRTELLAKQSQNHIPEKIARPIICFKQLLHSRMPIAMGGLKECEASTIAPWSMNLKTLWGSNVQGTKLLRLSWFKALSLARWLSKS